MSAEACAVCGALVQDHHLHSLWHAHLRRSFDIAVAGKPLPQADVAAAEQRWAASETRSRRLGADMAAGAFDLDPPEYDVETDGPVLPEWLTWPWVLVLVVFTIGVVMIIAGELS